MGAYFLQPLPPTNFLSIAESQLFFLETKVFFGNQSLKLLINLLNQAPELVPARAGALEKLFTEPLMGIWSFS